MTPRDTLASQIIDALAFVFLMVVLLALYCLLNPSDAYAAYEVRPAPVTDTDRIAVVVATLATIAAALFLACLALHRRVSRIRIDPHSEAHGDLPSQPARED